MNNSRGISPSAAHKHARQPSSRVRGEPTTEQRSLAPSRVHLRSGGSCLGALVQAPAHNTIYTSNRRFNSLFVYVSFVNTVVTRNVMNHKNVLLYADSVGTEIFSKHITPLPVKFSCATRTHQTGFAGSPEHHRTSVFNTLGPQNTMHLGAPLPLRADRGCYVYFPCTFRLYFVGVIENWITIRRGYDNAVCHIVSRYGPFFCIWRENARLHIQNWLTSRINVLWFIIIIIVALV